MTTWLGTDAYGLDEPPDLRLLAPAATAWLAALAALSAPPWAAWSLAGVAGAGAAVVLLAAARPPLEAVALTAAASLACAATVAAVAGVQVHRVERSAAGEAAEQGREAEFEAVVTSDPRPRSGTPRPGRAGWVIDARTAWVRSGGTERASAAPVVVLASEEEWRELLPGQTFRARGVFLGTEDDPLTAALVLVRGPPEEVGRPGGLQSFAGLVRERLREASSGLSQPEAGLLPALIVGDASGVPPETAEDFRETGMTHLLTVSGANLAVLTGFVLALTRLLRTPPWCSVAGGAAVIWVFVLVCRPEPSVVRAAFMGSLGLLALATGRAHAGLGALAVTVVGVLFVAPGLAASFGFALSVLATAGILLLVPPWTRAWSARLPRPVAEALAVALAAQVAVSPVLVLLSGELSWIAVPANVLAAPVVAAVTVAGTAVAALAVVWPGAAAVAAHLPGLGVSWIAAVAGAGARVPHGALAWRSDLVGGLVLAAVLAALVFTHGRLRRVVAAVVAAVLLLALAARCVPGGWPPPGWALVACDVGQGTAFVLSAGPGSAVVADTGEDPDRVDDCLGRLGVREVALLILSHDHADHVDGTPGVLRHRSVGAALAPPGFGESGTGRLLAEAGVRLLEAARGQRLRVGPWLLRVLWPEPGFTGSVNDSSVVVRADGTALTVLLTGDIEEEAQGRLLEGPNADLLRVTVLAVPHHGAGSQEPAFLEATDPVVSVTSVGADNTYGHPAPFTWNILERVARVNLRTDRDGDVAVLDGGGSGPGQAVVRGPDPAR
ncbi:ComEC/Rec2 family competence protein [Nocardiopsis dassonvillei]|uniref:ComEC/Rec2-related protein n=2 Tax=Nocardiopsis TaxID=2013 RepID=D7AYE7_NOCDD|nr:ComEC/Rec2 family competence protein [Nocardiopsis dassonvillei]ADH66132.1 ComEC/Rec2-related protein [Nocardiopsis dassonvillei subsp. dassonvillei DSM 43111]VEI92152.1 ComEC family competence protein [Nocardiopsis dassonvillei]